MHITLPESSPLRQRSPGGVLVSAVVHALVIGTTVVATGMSAPRPTPPPPPLEALVFVKPEHEAVPASARVRQVEPPPGSIRDAPPVAPLEVPSVDVAVDLTVVPITIPELTASLGAAWQAPGAVASAVSGASGTPAGEATGAAPMRAHTVDREVVPRAGATPQYPTQLASAGIEGTVVARFVVDTLGRVEPGSIQLSAGSHALFGQSVREALGRMRFDPAESGGRSVRQLVQQSFTFSLTRR
ncbi:MAG: TonB family protein [Gemmatimonadetes bacterium]|nr:TonB family protein [Gemmatimonadota bacterium]